MTSKRYSRCFVLALAPDARPRRRVDKFAVFSVHKRSTIDYIHFYRTMLRERGCHSNSSVCLSVCL